MKKLLLTILGTVASLAAFPAEISDYCGDYQCTFIDEWNNPTLNNITIKQSTKPNKITIIGLYNAPSLGSAYIDADIDLEAGTVTIPHTDLVTLESGLSLFRGTWTDAGFTDICTDPIIGHLEEEGRIVFDPADTFCFGEFNEANPEESSFYTLLRNVTLSPREDLTFVYNEEEWTPIGTAEYPDVCFGYKIFDERQPVVSTVTVVQNKENPKVIALLNPYQTSTWLAVNIDRKGEGQIVIDLSDPYFVVIRPYVYSGFNYNYGGLSLGKTYVYNQEGFYTKIAGMSIDEARELLLSYAMRPSTYEEGNVNVPAGSMIFATEDKPTSKYAFGDIEADILFDDDAYHAIEAALNASDDPFEGVDEIDAESDAEAVYYDLTGARVANPQPGNIYICRRGTKATKIIL